VLGARTRVVAITHVSNAVGAITPLAAVVALVRARSDALLVVDGAQGAPHLPVAFDALGVDFYACSAHKLLGPMGVGVLAGRRAVLEAMPPWHHGGDMIEVVGDEDSTWNVLPHRFEAGTPNAAGAVALAAAVRVLESIGVPAIRAHEVALLVRAEARLRALPGVTVYGPPAAERSGVLSFTVEGVHPHDLATILDQHGVCIRAGHHCAQPLMRRLEVPATARASFYVYSDEADADALADGVAEAVRLFGVA
jgi:cysteine desulfurase/selenocysteine lyase